MSSNTQCEESSSSGAGKIQPLKLTLKSVKRKLVLAQQQRTDDRVAELRQEQDNELGSSASKGRNRRSQERSPEPEIYTAQEADSRNIYSRKGRGVIDRFEFEDEELLRRRSTVRRVAATAPRTKTEIAKSAAVNRDLKKHHYKVGPASGLPPPIPDPRFNRTGPLRTSRITVDVATWTGVEVKNGVFEWSRVSSTGHQEWLSAREEQQGEWTIIRSKSTKR